MNAIPVLARKEFREGIRNRWVLAATAILTALALSITLLGSAPTGTIGASAVDVVVASLASLAILVVPLLALLLSFDAIVGEAERGTMALLLSYPLGRGTILMGKFLGQLLMLALAIAIGFGLAALVLVLQGVAAPGASWFAFLRMLLSSILLGAVFLALGHAISAFAASRGSAAGMAIGLWFFLILFYDMALLAALAAGAGGASASTIVDTLLILNPGDGYRLLNLGQGGAADVAGMAGAMAGKESMPLLTLLALGLWVVVPLAVAALLFRRRAL